MGVREIWSEREREKASKSERKKIGITQYNDNHYHCTNKEKKVKILGHEREEWKPTESESPDGGGACNECKLGWGQVCRRCALLLGIGMLSQTSHSFHRLTATSAVPFGSFLFMEYSKTPESSLIFRNRRRGGEAPYVYFCGRRK